MIITRTPFRISFAGGGSDIASFYEKHDGCVVSTAIDKYMYIAIHPNFNRKETILKYSVTETVNDVSDIQHKYFKRILGTWTGKSTYKRMYSMCQRSRIRAIGIGCRCRKQKSIIAVSKFRL